MSSFHKNKKIFSALVSCFLILTNTPAGYTDNYLEKIAFTSGQVQSTILHIAERGRYSLQVKSATGTELVLIDRMAGVLKKDGRTGRRDGRIDIVLERGEYKVVLNTDQDVSGGVALSVGEFREKNQAPKLEQMPFLMDGDLINTALNDLEKRSYWIYVEQRSPLHLEVMGRTLSECQLWQDGQWLADLKPAASTFEAKAGQPMLYVEFFETLDPGYYLLECYGGEARAWAGEDNTFPLYIRRGVNYLGESTVKTLTISPFGRDAYWVSGKADFFELVRDDLEYTRLSIGYYNKSRNRYTNLRSASITKDSKEATCTLNYSQGGDKQWLIIQAAPGDEMVLTFFKKVNYYEFPITREKDQYWISGFSSREGKNSIDLTPLLMRNYPAQVLKHQAVTVGPGQPLVRKINLLGTNSVYLNIQKAGTYRILEDQESGAKSSYVFYLLEDLFNERNIDISPQLATDSFELTSGLYLLQLKPQKMGILHFVLCTESEYNSAGQLLNKEPEKPTDFFAWPQVTIDTTDREYSQVGFNERYNISGMLTVRKLPLELAEPLSFYLAGGQSVALAVQVKELSLLRIEGENYELSSAGQKLQNNSTIGAGNHTLQLTNKGQNKSFYTLSTVTEKSVQKPRPPVLQEADQLFPVITENQPYFNDYGRNQARFFLLRVTEPAIYRVETSGRLAMALAVRTTVVPNLFKAQQNGVGRNALIQAYLKPGDYLIQAGTLGQSRGRAGVHLTKTPLVEAGFLTLDEIKRNTVPADYALCFEINIEEKAEYRLDSYGLQNTFTHRLEDAEAWPFYSGSGRYFQLELSPGKYYYYSLAKPIKTRRLNLFTQVPETETAEPEIKNGHRCYAMELNQPVYNTWYENPGRKEDIYTIELIHPLTANFAVSEGMVADIVKQSDLSLATVAGGKSETLELTPDHYEFRVKSKEENNLFDYQISLFTNELIPGLTQQVRSLPATLTVNMGEEKLVDIYSFGLSDIKATLWDEEMREILAESDDMQNDWNFSISRKLAPGKYRLLLQKVGYWSGSTDIYMQQRAEAQLSGVSLPFAGRQNLGRTVLNIPFTSGPATGLVQISAQAGLPVWIGLYKGQTLLAQEQNRLFIPLNKNTDYQVQFWTGGEQDISVDINVQSLKEQQIDLTNKTKQYTFSKAVRFKNTPTLSFRLQAGKESILFSPALEQPCSAVGRFPLNTVQDTGWAVMPDITEQSRVVVEPLILMHDEAASVMLGNTEHSLVVTNNANYATLLEVQSFGMQAGVMVQPLSGHNQDQYDWQGMDIKAFQTFTGILEPGKYQARVWTLQKWEMSMPQERVDIISRAYPLAEIYSLAKDKPLTVEIEAGKAVRLDLSHDWQKLNLLLARELVAFAWHEENCQGVFASLENNTNHEMIVPGGYLVVVNRGKNKALLRVFSSATQQEAKPVLSSRSGWEGVMLGQGRTAFSIKPQGNNNVLCVAGDDVEALLRADDGHYYYADFNHTLNCHCLPALKGELVVNHGTGYIKVWLAAEGSEDTIYQNQMRGLQSRQMQAGNNLLNKTQLWVFTMKQAGFVQIKTGAAGSTALYQGARLLRVEASATAGRSLFHYLQAGSYRVLTAPLAGKYQEGEILLTKIFPINIDEQSTDEFFIGPEELQVYGFLVQAPGLVGAGLAVESDLLDAELYDAGFKLIGQGNLIFQELAAGPYFLVVRSGDTPVQYRPLVVGLSGSLTEIPQSIIDQYKE